jgi:hypothetical protein
MAKLDLDRGVEIRFYPGNRMQIAMYADAPGAYYDATGKPVAAELARGAGFDVEKNLRKKVAQERLAAARKQIEAELRAEEDVIAEALSDKSKMDVRHVGGGQYALFSKENGKRLTKVAMTKADVEIMLGAAVPTDRNDSVSPALTDLSKLLGTDAAAEGTPAVAS